MARSAEAIRRQRVAEREKYQQNPQYYRDRWAEWRTANAEKYAAYVKKHQDKCLTEGYVPEKEERRLWTDTEIALIDISFYNRDMDDIELSHILQRTARAIRAKRWKIKEKADGTNAQ